MDRQVAIITGSARGIGKAIAIKLAEQGFNIVICDVDFEAVQSTKEEIEKKGAKVLGLKIIIARSFDSWRFFY